MLCLQLWDLLLTTFFKRLRTRLSNKPQGQLVTELSDTRTHSSTQPPKSCIASPVNNALPFAVCRGPIAPSYGKDEMDTKFLNGNGLKKWVGEHFSLWECCATIPLEIQSWILPTIEHSQHCNICHGEVSYLFKITQQASKQESDLYFGRMWWFMHAFILHIWYKICIPENKRYTKVYWEYTYGLKAPEVATVLKLSKSGSGQYLDGSPPTVHAALRSIMEWCN